jgi:site-specific DNA recombinase
MTHTFTRKKGRQYRYYTCVHAQKHGWATCPTKSIPAAEIEQVIVERIQVIGTDSNLVRATIKAAKEQLDKELRLVLADAKTCERDLVRLRKEEKKIFLVIGRGGTVAHKAAERLEEIGQNPSPLVL